MSNTKRMILVIIAALIVLAGLLGAPVQAGPEWSCDGGDACNFKHNSYNTLTGDKRCNTFSTSVTDYAGYNWWNCATMQPIGNDNMNDDLSSIKNRSTTKCMRWFGHANYGGAVKTLGPLGQDPNLGNDALDDNQASSHLIYTC